MNQRIYKYGKENNIFSENQSGFMESHRTEDNIFTLNTIINSHVKCKKKLFAVFVDFSKFFDCINRNMLCFKLLQLGITGTMYKLIKSMYSNCKYCIKTCQIVPK